MKIKDKYELFIKKLIGEIANAVITEHKVEKEYKEYKEAMLGRLQRDLHQQSKTEINSDTTNE